VYLKKKDR